MKKQDNSTYEYNIKRIEPLFRYKLSVVLKKHYSSNITTNLLNKDFFNHLYDVLKTSSRFNIQGGKLLPKSSIHGFITKEQQRDTGLLHFHCLFGPLHAAELNHHQTDDFRAKIVSRLKQVFEDSNLVFFASDDCLYKRKLIKKNNQYRVRTGMIPLGYPVESVHCDLYTEGCGAGDWINYILKDDPSPYITSASHSLIKRINDIESRPGMIPPELLRLKLEWTENRLQQHTEAQMKHFERLWEEVESL
jgi:hypothetical protein